MNDLHQATKISTKKTQNMHRYSTPSTKTFTDDNSSSERSLAAVKHSIQVELNLLFESVNTSLRLSTKSETSLTGFMQPDLCETDFKKLS